MLFDKSVPPVEFQLSPAIVYQAGRLSAIGIKAYHSFTKQYQEWITKEFGRNEKTGKFGKDTLDDQLERDGLDLIFGSLCIDIMQADIKRVCSVGMLIELIRNDYTRLVECHDVVTGLNPELVPGYVPTSPSAPGVPDYSQSETKDPTTGQPIEASEAVPLG